MKKAARAVGEKSIDMLKSKELLPLTGYIHGGCSPIGMKKVFPTTFQHEAENFDTIIFSAGKIGYQVEMPLSSLSKIIRYQTADISLRRMLMNNKIKLRTPGYYKNFHCISSECKDNCCVGGWQIDIDEETAEYYST